MRSKRVRLAWVLTEIRSTSLPIFIAQIKVNTRHLKIIPWARVKYEMVNNQLGA